MSTFSVEVAIVDNGRVLLVREPPLHCWRLPGGPVLDGMTLSGAAIRHTKEQTGLDIRLGRLIGLYSRPQWRAGGDTACVVLGLTMGGRRELGARVDRARYFFPNALPDNLFPWDRQRIADVFSGQQRGIIVDEQVVWPFATQEMDQILPSLAEEGFAEPEAALAEALRRLGVVLSAEDVAALLQGS
ncbi:MAG: NUDIX hydrolase [Chloroflexi bacterium]|nr:NUDIX hydrolase [Chloroflexota bacterium]